MILSTFNAPLFALVGLAAFIPRRVARGGLGGFSAGVASAGLHQSLVFAGVFHYGSQMSANFYAGDPSFSVTCVGTVAVGSIRRPVDAEVGIPEGPVRVPSVVFLFPPWCGP